MIVIGGAQPGTVDVGRGTDVRWFVSEKETEELRPMTYDLYTSSFRRNGCFVGL